MMIVTITRRPHELRGGAEHRRRTFRAYKARQQSGEWITASVSGRRATKFEKEKDLSASDESASIGFRSNSQTTLLARDRICTLKAGEKHAEHA